MDQRKQQVLQEYANLTPDELKDVIYKLRGDNINLSNEVRKYMSLHRELLDKQNKIDESNFFEIQLNEKYQIVTEKFTNTVEILDQSKDFIKYKGTNNAIYYINKTSIVLLKIQQ